MSRVVSLQSARVLTGMRIGDVKVVSSERSQTVGSREDQSARQTRITRPWEGHCRKWLPSLGKTTVPLGKPVEHRSEKAGIVDERLADGARWARYSHADPSSTSPGIYCQQPNVLVSFLVSVPVWILENPMRQWSFVLSSFFAPDGCWMLFSISCNASTALP